MKRYDLLVEASEGEWVRFADVEVREAYWRDQLSEAGRNAAAGAQAVRDEAYAMNERLTNEMETLAAENARLTRRVADLKFAMGDEAGWLDRFQSVRAENARLRAALRGLKSKYGGEP